MTGSYGGLGVNTGAGVGKDVVDFSVVVVGGSVSYVIVVDRFVVVEVLLE